LIEQNTILSKIKTIIMQTINKQEALKRLTSLENEAAQLRKIIDAPTDVTERVQSVEDACRELGKPFPSFSDPYKQAEALVEIFAEAMRGGKPAGECYYYPYFRRSSGGGFSFDGCD